MKACFILWIALMSACTGFGQDNSLIRIRPWDDVEEVIPYSRRYQYHPFLPGHVLYANGKTSASVKLNYDILFGEMRMIKNPHEMPADTLFIVNDHALKYVFIGKDIYYHDFRKGYLLLLAEAHDVQLGVSRLLRKKRRESSFSNGYNLSVDNTSAVYSGSDIILETRSYYYMITEDDAIRTVNRANVLKTFPLYRPALESYIDEHAINWRNESDLVNLFRFCSGLTQSTIR